MGYWKSAQGPTLPPVKVVAYVSTVLVPPPEPDQQASDENALPLEWRRIEVPPAAMTHGLELGQLTPAPSSPAEAKARIGGVKFLDPLYMKSVKYSSSAIWPAVSAPPQRLETWPPEG